MQYILNESEYNSFLALRKENEELRAELVKHASDAYENHKLAASRLLQIGMLKDQITEMKRDLAGTEAQLATSRSVADELEQKLQRANQKLQQFKKLAGSDFDILLNSMKENLLTNLCP